MNDFFQFISERYFDILFLTWEHFYISMIAVLSGFIVSVPLGIFLAKTKEKFSRFVIGLVNIIQTIPSLALIGFMIPFLGIGTLPAITALFLYSLLPILRNTYTGIKEVNPAIKEAAIGMGMSNFQMMFRVELPLTMSVIIGGFRTATIYTIGWATLAALIGGGGLGYLVFTGLAVSNETYIIVGAIATAFLAAITDLMTRKLQKICTPTGLTK
jgi:osmoprotectant transport system permease protein